MKAISNRMTAERTLKNGAGGGNTPWWTEQDPDEQLTSVGDEQIMRADGGFDIVAAEATQGPFTPNPLERGNFYNEATHDNLVHKEGTNNA